MADELDNQQIRVFVDGRKINPTKDMSMEDIKVAESRIEGSGPTREWRTGGPSTLDVPKSSSPAHKDGNGATILKRMVAQ